MICRFVVFTLFFDNTEVSQNMLEWCKNKNGNYIFAVSLNRMLLFQFLEKKEKHNNPGISMAKSLLLAVFAPVDLPPVRLLK